MRPRVAVSDAHLVPSAAAIQWTAASGESWAIMGPSQSGKTALLEVIGGRRKLARGSVRTEGRPAWAECPSAGRRWTPQSVASVSAGRSRSAEATEALARLGLWDLRRHHVATLPDALQAAVAMLPAILEPAEIVVVDGVLDRLDPWRRRSAWELLRERLHGRTTFVATGLADVAAEIGRLAVLRQGEMVFRGTVLELLTQTRPQKLVIETEDDSTIAAMVAPVALQMEEVKGGLVISLPPGQEKAVQLLLHGYGTVRAVHVQLPRLEDAVLGLCSP